MYKEVLGKKNYWGSITWIVPRGDTGLREVQPFPACPENTH